MSGKVDICARVFSFSPASRYNNGMHLAPETESAGDRLDDVMLDIVLARYRVLARDYERLWGLPCVLAGSDGRILAGECRCTGCLTADDCAVVRQQAIAEALRWGEPAVSLCPHGDMLWAVPVMWNARVLGGLFVLRPDGSHETLRTQEIHRAAHSLREMAEGADLTNAALLELRRESARRESERAEAIHELKEQSYHSIRDIYLLEEPALLAAIKRGDRATAREIINRILVGIYFLGRERPQLLKSFLLELVVTMSRSAVEAGGDPRGTPRRQLLRFRGAGRHRGRGSAVRVAGRHARTRHRGDQLQSALPHRHPDG